MGLSISSPLSRAIRAVLVALVAELPLALASCGGEPPRRPNVMHPVHERRAEEIIGRVFKESGMDPERGHSILVTTRGASLSLDVSASGRKFGVAYLTREEAQDLGDAVPRYDPESDALVIVDGVGKDAGWHALLLYDRAYLSDDLEGEAHSVTTIAAEKKIERDARDFVVKAKHENWP